MNRDEVIRSIAWINCPNIERVFTEGRVGPCPRHIALVEKSLKRHDISTDLIEHTARIMRKSDGSSGYLEEDLTELELHFAFEVLRALVPMIKNGDRNGDTG